MDLKPCAKCKSRNVYICTHEHTIKGKAWYIWCQNCRNMTQNYDTLKKAKEAWNNNK